MTAPTLPAFLLARYAEDEAAAKAYTDGLLSDDDLGYPALLLRGTDRMLSECEAKRRIVELHRPFREPATEYDCMGCPHNTPANECPTLRLLALPFAGHPDYDESWKP